MDKEQNPARLRQQLTGLQIYFIVLSLVIGTGVFGNNGEVLKLAGPMGLLVAVLIFGVVAVFVGETISELVQLFPVPNAIFEYVDTFVDRDVAWAVGILYWYTYSSIFPLQMLGAANLVKFWGIDDVWPRIFAAIWPFCLLAVNLIHVKVFGWIETISGAIKLAIIFIISVMLYAVAASDSNNNFLSDGFKNTAPYAETPGKAFCYGLPKVAFSYLGIESIAMAAFEARSVRDITRFSKLTHWTVLLAYFLCTIGIIMTVKWNSPSLPGTFDPSVNDLRARAAPNRTTNAAILGAASHTGPGASALPSVVNAFLGFCTLSAANAALYVSSRTLYGLTYQRGNSAVSGFLQRHTGVVWPRTGAPAQALFWSVILWYWLPYLDIVRAGDKDNKGVPNFIHIIETSLSVSCLIVWAALCLAYCRFHRWMRKCSRHIEGDEICRPFLPTSSEYRARNWLAWLQPLPAYFGFFACLVIFVLVSTTMWDTGFDVTKLFAAYFAHLVFIIIVLGRKLYNRFFRRGTLTRGWVRLEDNRGGAELRRKLLELHNLGARAADRRRDLSPEDGGEQPHHHHHQQKQPVVMNPAPLDTAAPHYNVESPDPIQQPQWADFYHENNVNKTADSLAMYQMHSNGTPPRPREGEEVMERY